MNDDVAELRAELAALRAEVEHLRAERAEIAEIASVGINRSTRRGLIGAAAAATVAGLVASRPAAAVDPNDIALGVTNSSNQTTEVTMPLSAAPRSHVFIAQDGIWNFPNTSADAETGTKAAVGGYAGNHMLHGLFGFTNTQRLGASGARLQGESPQSYGLIVGGRRASMRITRPGPLAQTPPPNRFDFHNDGEITLDSNNDLWVCVGSGNPGTWRKLAGPASAGTFHAISPVRVYDSRVPGFPLPGAFAPNTSRLISVADGRNGNNGVVTAKDAVPVGASAVAFNVTAVNTSGGNHLSVVPGNVASTATSTLNWAAAGAIVANSAIVGVDGQRRIKVIAGPGSYVDVIVDIAGYWR